MINGYSDTGGRMERMGEVTKGWGKWWGKLAVWLLRWGR